jgi:hypothetical protein
MYMRFLDQIRLYYPQIKKNKKQKWSSNHPFATPKHVSKIHGGRVRGRSTLPPNHVIWGWYNHHKSLGDALASTLKYMLRVAEPFSFNLIFFFL